MVRHRWVNTILLPTLKRYSARGSASGRTCNVYLVITVTVYCTAVYIYVQAPYALYKLYVISTVLRYRYMTRSVYGTYILYLVLTTVR